MAPSAKGHGHSRVLLPHDLNTGFLQLIPRLDRDVPQMVKGFGEEHSGRYAFDFIADIYAGRDLEMAYHAGAKLVISKAEITIPGYPHLFDRVDRNGIKVILGRATLKPKTGEVDSRLPPRSG